jgi:hypothetical protein
MANIDYVVIAPGPSDADVVAAVMATTGSVQTDKGLAASSR